MIDAKTALDNVLAAANAVLPAVEDFDRFTADRGAAMHEVIALRNELAKVQSAVASARSEVTSAQEQLQRIKEETVWALKDLGRIRQELDELERAKRRRG